MTGGSTVTTMEQPSLITTQAPIPSVNGRRRKLANSIEFAYCANPNSCIYQESDSETQYCRNLETDETDEVSYWQSIDGSFDPLNGTRSHCDEYTFDCIGITFPGGAASLEIELVVVYTKQPPVHLLSRNELVMVDLG